MQTMLGVVNYQRPEETTEEAYAHRLHDSLVYQHYLTEDDACRKATMVAILALRETYPTSRRWRRSDAEKP